MKRTSPYCRALILAACLSTLPAAAQTTAHAGGCFQTMADMMELTLLAERCRPARPTENAPFWQGFQELEQRMAVCNSELDSAAKQAMLPAVQQRFEQHPLNPEHGNNTEAQRRYCARSTEHLQRIIQPYLP